MTREEGASEGGAAAVAGLTSEQFAELRDALALELRAALDDAATPAV